MHESISDLLGFPAGYFSTAFCSFILNSLFVKSTKFRTIFSRWLVKGKFLVMRNGDQIISQLVAIKGILWSILLNYWNESMFFTCAYWKQLCIQDYIFCFVLWIGRKC